MKKLTALIMSCIMLFSLAGCNKGAGDDKNVTVRFLNFKPEIASVYNEIVQAYKEETGVTVIVDTAANNTYESTLAARMGTSEAPTIFQINGPRGYANWSDYCKDLTDSKLYSHLNDKSMAVTKDGKVFGIPYLIEGYGIIYNEELTDKYFALSDKNTDFMSMDEINNFEKLSQLVTDMQKNKDKLGINGVFAATSLKSGEDWRWQTHLANLPIYYEFKNNDIDLSSDATKEIKFEYAENYKNIFDLYINNSTTDPKLLGSKIGDESMAEFALGQCAMVQNGNWAWSQISGISGNVVKEDKIKFLPIYTGVEGEEKQGLCIGTENFMCINSKASEAEQKAAEDFMYWLFTSDKGKDYVTNKLDFIAPFDSFTDEEIPTDPLAREVIEWSKRADVESVPWNFTLFPSQTFKNDFGAALLQYAQGTKTWSEVVTLVTEEWKTESAKL
ncbi:MAG: carbohydrate ABC transporter substrate-binding protein [Clostridia bacterium]|nr:carbohydrate ABC transporter substrate-binding protein [Clostridia bacterium]